MNQRSTAGGGFTLIELMVTIALVAILMAVAAPNLSTFLRNAELSSFTNSLLASINAARGEAMKRGRYAMLVPTDGAIWESGWIVFVDVDRTGTYTSANDIVIATREAPPSYLTITGNGSATEGAGSSPYIMYDASGYSKLTLTGGFGASTFDIKRNDVSGSELLAQTRRLKIASTGRARVCTPKTTTDPLCTASATD